jgi:DNA-directed RNA polymerase specialized sigma24 family protein
MDQLWRWAARYREEGRGVLVVAAYAKNHGTPKNEACSRADDAVQSALLRVVQRGGQRPDPIEDYRHFHNSVTRAAINLLIDENRRMARQCGLETVGELMQGEGTDPRLEAIQESICRVAVEHRTLLQASFEEGDTLDTLADRVLPPDTRTINARRLVVRRQLLKAMVALRDELLASYPELDWSLPTVASA